MFEQFKELGRIKKMQSEMAGKKEVVEKEGVKIVMNGKMEIEEIQLNPDLDLKQQENILKECINEASKKIQMSLAQKLFEKGISM